MVVHCASSCRLVLNAHVMRVYLVFAASDTISLRLLSPYRNELASMRRSIHRCRLLDAVSQLQLSISIGGGALETKNATQGQSCVCCRFTWKPLVGSCQMTQVLCASLICEQKDMPEGSFSIVQELVRIRLEVFRSELDGAAPVERLATHKHQLSWFPSDRQRVSVCLIS